MIKNKQRKLAFTHLAAVQATDVATGQLTVMLYGLDLEGQCWTNIAGRGWHMHMELQIDEPQKD